LRAGREAPAGSRLAELAAICPTARDMVRLRIVVIDRQESR